MPRSYRHIQGYEKEIMELRSKGKIGREICESLGVSEKQYKNFITRYNKKQQKLIALFLCLMAVTTMLLLFLFQRLFCIG